MVNAVVLSTLAEHRTRFAIFLAYGQSYLGSCLTHEVVYTRAMISDKPLIPYSSSNVRALLYLIEIFICERFICYLECRHTSWSYVSTRTSVTRSKHHKS